MPTHHYDRYLLQQPSRSATRGWQCKGSSLHVRRPRSLIFARKLRLRLEKPAALAAPTLPIIHNTKSQAPSHSVACCFQTRRFTAWLISGFSAGCRASTSGFLDVDMAPNVDPGLMNPWLINRGVSPFSGDSGHFWREHPPNNGTGST